MHVQAKSLAVLAATLAVVAAASPCSAKDFAEITAAERAMTAVPGEPNAPAVMVFLRGDMSIMDPSRSQYSSILEVEGRIKILNAEGLGYAEQEIFHGSDEKRLRNLRARTVLADGTVVPVGEDAVFRKQASRSDKLYVTSLAFPRVEPGAILDYHYEVHFDSYFIGPWLFQSKIPTLHSEIVYHVPTSLGVQPWGRATFGREMKNDVNRTPRGGTIKVWMDGLPAIPDEPYRYPDFDLSSVFNLTAVEDNDYEMKLFSDWPTVCARFDEWFYREARKKSKQTRTRAKALAAEAPGARATAERIYRFVRDDIRTKRVEGVTVPEESTLDDVLERGEGDYAEKALVLQAMLDAVGIDSQLVWVRHRDSGMIDMKFVYPAWFEEMIVRADIDGQPVLLDPSDRRIAFGKLQPGYEGTPALLFDSKAPQTITIPATPYEQNVRRADVDLVLDDAGRVTGTGTLVYEGHHARERMEWMGDAEKTRKAWEDWMREAYPGFEVTPLEVVEDREGGRVTVKWSLAQREEEVLGDEASFRLSRPLSVADQPFSLPTESRRTPVLLEFPDRDHIRVRVSWPETWKIEVQPRAGKLESEAGALITKLEVGPDQRSIAYERTLDTRQREFATGKPYHELRTLYAAAEESDAQSLVLVRR